MRCRSGCTQRRQAMPVTTRLLLAVPSGPVDATPPPVCAGCEVVWGSSTSFIAFGALEHMLPILAFIVPNIFFLTQPRTCLGPRNGSRATVLAQLLVRHIPPMGAASGDYRCGWLIRSHDISNPTMSSPSTSNESSVFSLDSHRFRPLKTAIR